MLILVAMCIMVAGIIIGGVLTIYIGSDPLTDAVARLICPWHMRKPPTTGTLRDRGAAWTPDGFPEWSCINRPFEDTDLTLHVLDTSDAPCPIVRCSTCHSTTFQVGIGSLATAIRCTTCGWESKVHEG